MIRTTTVFIPVFSMLFLSFCAPAPGSLDTEIAPGSSQSPANESPPAAETTPFPTMEPGETSGPAVTATTAVIPTVTATPTQTATGSAGPADAWLSELVWFAPNMGSRDYTELFSKPDLWSNARSKIDVFKFYTQNVIDAPCDICGDNILISFINVQAFKRLNEWGIALAVEVGAVKEWGCTGEEEFRVAERTIRNIQYNGGVVSFLAMDEPYIGGELVANGQTCGYTMEQSADVTSDFIKQVRTTYPDIVVGDIEPYPYFSVSQLENWIDALEERGATPSFFHLDVDIERARVEGQDVLSGLRTLSRFFQEHQIPFGVIFTSDWKAAGSDHAYFDSTMEWIKTVDDAIGKPQHLIFQSWQGPALNGIHEVPINLPDDDPASYSHTRLILEGLAEFDR